jgi:hypothetical protein
MAYYTVAPARPARRRIRRRMTQAGLGDDSIMGAIMQAGKRGIRRVVFRSAISPEIELDPNQEGPRTAGQGGGSEAFLRFAKPAWYLDVGGSVVKLAFWGEPTTNYFPLIAGAAVIAGAVGLGLVIRGLRRR